MFRPSLLVVGSVALTLGAAILVLWPGREGNGAAVPRRVQTGDQEIVWLNAATSAVAWERFVTALRQVAASDEEFRLDESGAFPPQTATVPEVILTHSHSPGRLWFRWYKLTGDTSIRDWVRALTRRDPPPLAIIGGGSSDRARDLAEQLQLVARQSGPSAPLFLITTATADEVAAPEDPAREVRLDQIYPGRTFRFCFTNRQMARAIADFIWGQEDLRPDAMPVYLVAWKDDPYSVDLYDGFREILWDEQFLGGYARRQAVSDATSDWAALAGLAAGGGMPPGTEAVRLYREPPPGPYWGIHIAHSVGSFHHPNGPETDAAERLMAARFQYPRQQRPLLILPATAQPARRFLRGLMRIAPAEASRFVVATGDSLDFNTLYRDRQLTWPIQDLPFSLVVFCHYNPLDTTALGPEQQADVHFTGLEDLRLYADIAEAVAEAAWQSNGLVSSADALAVNLRALQPARFDADGNRPEVTGEHIVCLKPVRLAGRLTPQALLQVYRSRAEAVRQWDLLRELRLDYAQSSSQAGGLP